MRRPRISFGFCALVCFLAWLDLTFCLWFLACSFVHELGHLLAMKLCRVPVDGVWLGASGAVIQGRFRDYKSELICAAAGPVLGLAAGAVFLRCVPKGAVISVLLSLVNLLPLSTLDGGRILRAALLLRCEEHRAQKICHVVSVNVCCALMVLACWGTVYLQAGLWPIFAALVLLWRVGGRE